MLNLTIYKLEKILVGSDTIQTHAHINVVTKITKKPSISFIVLCPGHVYWERCKLLPFLECVTLTKKDR